MAGENKIHGMRKPRQRLRKHYMREWRKFRGLTQEQAASRLEITQATLSRIEQLLIPYSQNLLEGAAIAYDCEPSDILNVNPLMEGEVIDLTRILREAAPEVRAEILGYAKGRLGKGA